MAGADYSEVRRIQKRMKEASRDIAGLQEMYGMARQVVAADRKGNHERNMLAPYVVKYLKDDKSKAAAEQFARADPAYLAEFKLWQSNLTDAYHIVAKWDSLHISWETARSLLAMQRQTLRELPETEG
jgi:hypothetical protein